MDDVEISVELHWQGYYVILIGEARFMCHPLNKHDIPRFGRCRTAIISEFGEDTWNKIVAKIKAIPTS